MKTNGALGSRRAPHYRCGVTGDAVKGPLQLASGRAIPNSALSARDPGLSEFCRFCPAEHPSTADEHDGSRDAIGNRVCLQWHEKVERGRGIEPLSTAWKAAALPLSYPR